MTKGKKPKEENRMTLDANQEKKRQEQAKNKKKGGCCG